jgi:asparagine synthase (glutamine-hydrolysing)
MGFSVPLASWFRTGLKSVFESALLSNGAGELLHTEQIRHLWAEHQSGIHNHDRKLWNLLILTLWHKRFREAKRSEALEAVGSS